MQKPTLKRKNGFAREDLQGEKPKIFDKEIKKENRKHFQCDWQNCVFMKNSDIPKIQKKSR